MPSDAGRDEHRLRNRAGEALQRERRARQHLARVAPVPVGLDAQQLQRRVVRAREPRAKLERGPLVAPTAERNEHGSAGVE